MKHRLIATKPNERIDVDAIFRRPGRTTDGRVRSFAVHAGRRVALERRRRRLAPGAASGIGDARSTEISERGDARRVGIARGPAVGTLSMIVAIAVALIAASAASHATATPVASHPRLVIDAIRCVDSSRALDAVKTVVIKRGRIVEIGTPGTVEIRPGDRQLRGLGGILVTGQQKSVDFVPDALTLRCWFVDGVTSIVIERSDEAECIERLATEWSLRLPRLRYREDAANASDPVGLVVGASADLLIRTLPAKLANEHLVGLDSDQLAKLPLRLLLTARATDDPGGVVVVYPGELHFLSGLLGRLERQRASTLAEFPAVFERFQSQGEMRRTGPVRVGNYSVDAIPRGLIWSWEAESHLGVREYHTLMRMFEPLNSWTHLIEEEANDGGLVAVRLTFVELNAPRPSPTNPAADPASAEPDDGGKRWGDSLPLERVRLEIVDDRLRRHRDDDETAGSIHVDPRGIAITGSDPLFMIEGIPTARSARRLAAAFAAASIDFEAAPDVAGESRSIGSVDLLRLSVDPVQRGITARQESLRAVAACPCVPSSTPSSIPGEWVGDCVGLTLLSGLDDPDGEITTAAATSIWVGPNGNLVAVTQNGAFGFIGFVREVEE